MHNHRREGLSILSIIIVFIIAFTFSCDQKDSNNKGQDIGHFDPKGKAPSDFTIAKWEDLKKTMPFEDKRDFEEQKKGFIEAPEYTEIMADAGHVAWSMGTPGGTKYELWFV